MSVELVAGYVAAYNRLRLLAGAQIGQLWDRFGGLDDRTLDQFVSAAVPTMHAAETATARLTAGYLTTMRRQVLGGAPTPDFAIRDLIGANLRGVDPTEVFSRPTVTARTAIADGKPFPEAMRAGRLRATELAQTNVMLTQRATVNAMPADRRVVGYRRVLTGSSCVLCATASTQRYRTGQLHPIHSHCVAGETVVSARSAKEVTRRWYQGEVVVVRTAAGNDLTVTPNHPILTNRGWVCAGELREGMYLVSRTIGHGAVSGVPNESDMPSRIEDRFRAGSMTGLVAVPFAAEHFHGDRGDGDVDVVFANSDLADGLLAEFDQPVKHSPFSVGESAGRRLPALCETHEDIVWSGLASNGGMGGADLSQALFSGHAGSTALASRRSAPGLNTVEKQMTADRYAVDANPLRDGQLRLSREVTLDRVAKLLRVYRSCHVYNLHTENGWYYAGNIVVHNCDCGVAEIFGNSDPGHVINGKLLEELKVQARHGQQTLGAAVKSAQSNLEVTERRLTEIRATLQTETDAGRRARLADRETHYTQRRAAEKAALKEQQAQMAAFQKRRVPPDTVAVHHHGELGPVLTFEGDHFTNEAEALH